VGGSFIGPEASSANEKYGIPLPFIVFSYAQTLCSIKFVQIGFFVFERIANSW
jgi:hypothetical protein